MAVSLWLTDRGLNNLPEAAASPIHIDFSSPLAYCARTIPLVYRQVRASSGGADKEFFELVVFIATTAGFFLSAPA
jgi:hypothetical protein